VDRGKDKGAPILHSAEKPVYRKELKGERKAIASRYYQLLMGHTLVAPFLKEKLKKRPMLVVRDW